MHLHTLENTTHTHTSTHTHTHTQLIKFLILHLFQKKNTHKLVIVSPNLDFPV